MWYDTQLGAHYVPPSSTESIANLWEVYNYFHGLSTPWAVESIAAVAGNMSVESYFNPYIRETTESGAFGLVQWITHKSDMIAWANSQGLRPTSGPAQVQYIEQERQGIDDQWSGRGDFAGMTMSDFAYNRRGYTVSRLAYCWWRCYERSAEYQQSRGTRAEYFYEVLTGSPPPGTIYPWMLKKKKPWWKPGGTKYVTV